MSKRWAEFLISFTILVFAGILISGAILADRAASDRTVEESVESTEDIEGPEDSEDSNDEPEENDSTTEIDFQSVIDEWIKTVSGNKSVLIYDLDLDKAVGSYNLEEDYNTASLYKLFVVYEGYKRVEAGVWDGDKKAGSTGYTINQCLDLAIRESHSPCAETLWGMIGRDNLDKIIETEWGITDSDISKLTSNVSDIYKIMRRFYEHPDFNDAKILDAMRDSFLNQPRTTYDWRQGLPSGFSEASVYNKVGWDYNPDKKYWNIYHDAAIVKFPLENGKTRDFIVVVMTNKVDYKYIKNLGAKIEEYFCSF